MYIIIRTICQVRGYSALVLVLVLVIAMVALVVTFASCALAETEGDTLLKELDFSYDGNFEGYKCGCCGHVIRGAVDDPVVESCTEHVFENIESDCYKKWSERKLLEALNQQNKPVNNARVTLASLRSQINSVAQYDRSRVNSKPSALLEHESRRKENVVAVNKVSVDQTAALNAMANLEITPKQMPIAKEKRVASPQPMKNGEAKGFSRQKEAHVIKDPINHYPSFNDRLSSLRNLNLDREGAIKFAVAGFKGDNDKKLTCCACKRAPFKNSDPRDNILNRHGDVYEKHSCQAVEDFSKYESAAKLEDQSGLIVKKLIEQGVQYQAIQRLERELEGSIESLGADCTETIKEKAIALMSASSPENCFEEYPVQQEQYYKHYQERFQHLPAEIPDHQAESLALLGITGDKLECVWCLGQENFHALGHTLDEIAANHVVNNPFCTFHLVITAVLQSTSCSFEQAVWAFNRLEHKRNASGSKKVFITYSMILEGVREKMEQGQGIEFLTFPERSPCRREIVSQNTPLATQQEPQAIYPDRATVEKRVATFRQWPSSSPMQPDELAKAGLFYTGSGDRVQCAFCGEGLNNWKPWDEPMAEHKLHFPHCPFVVHHDRQQGTGEGIASTRSTRHQFQTYTDPSFFSSADIRYPRPPQKPTNCYTKAELRTLPDPDFCGTNEFNWVINNFSSLKEQKELSFFSPPFYTEKGYKVCARIYPNGDGIAQGSHVSVFIVFMEGAIDCSLQWPFKGKVHFTLFDGNNGKVASDAFRADPTSSSFKQPKVGSVMNIASGSPLFAALSTLWGRQGDKLILKIKIEE